jgi:hypothetical protein
LVVYLFNPFSVQVMERVLRRLDESYDQHPREIVLVYVYPEFGFVLKNMRNFRLVEETGRYLVATSAGTPVRSEHTPLV